MKKEIFNLLNKYKEGETRDDQKVSSLLGGSEYQDDVKEFMKEDWAEILQDSNDSPRNLTPVLNKIHHLLRINDFKRTNNWKQKVLKWYSYAAAVLLIPLLIASVSYVLINNKIKRSLLSEVSFISIDAPNGRLVHFDLPDGTTGVLHGGSKLSYNLPFTNNRNIQLKGQAYFDVKHDENHPFIVRTKDMTVFDIGTCFEIKAFEEDVLKSVLLEQGKVICEIPSVAKKILLKPDHELIFNKQHFKIRKVNAKDLTRWKDGLLVFRDEKMENVAKELERWYNVDVTIEDDILRSYTFRATFNNEPIEEVLNLLSRTSPIRYEITNRRNIGSEVYSPKCIKIYSIKK